MNKPRFHFHKKYWFYIGAAVICSILLIGNIFRTDSWTGDKPFSEFVQRDWILLAVFLIEELFIGSVMFFFVANVHKISTKTQQEFFEKSQAQLESFLYTGIKPGDYDFVWFDYSDSERALVLKKKDIYILYVREYDERIDDWRDVNQVSVYDSLSELKKSLFFDFHFYFEENAEFDKYRNEIYKETQN